MEYFIDCGVSYSTKELAVLNRVHKYKKSHSLADILWCDGKTVDSEILPTRQTEVISTGQFSIEQSMKKDKDL